jgi:hypothetical protein
LLGTCVTFLWPHGLWLLLVLALLAALYVRRTKRAEAWPTGRAIADRSLAVARLAAQHGVRIYTIGIGTPDGAVYRGLMTATPVGIDERTLASIAVLTHAEYFYASTAPEKSALEVTALFCALGALLLAAGALLSVSRTGRIA